MIIVLVFLMSSSVGAAEVLPKDNSTAFSFYNSDNEIVTVSVTCAKDIATAKVYVDGVLTQASVANADTKTIETEVYDLDTVSKTAIPTSKGEMNGFTTLTVHMPRSDDKILETMNVQTRSVNSEPVDNTGLSLSVYSDGYYFLGSYGGLNYAPDVYGYLCRTYTRTYDGETHHWSWSAGDTISAISAYITLFGGPVRGIISILVFTALEVLTYNQSVELATYTYDYDYRVRVARTIYFTAERNVTYWRIDNLETGTTKWEQKRFNYGYSMANTEMVKMGIDNYLEENQ